MTERRHRSARAPTANRIQNAERPERRASLGPRAQSQPSKVSPGFLQWSPAPGRVKFVFFCYYLLLSVIKK